MKEDICTIPVNEVLARRDGCPICSMQDTLEDHMLNFILGDAMMEPDVRIQTNREGFCTRHFSMMLSRKNRLALALMLESRLKSVETTVFAKSGLLGADRGKKASEAMGSCYVCARVDHALDRLLDTFFRLWKKESEFRAEFEAQPILCLPHYTQLLAKARVRLDKKEFARFEQAASGVMRAGLSHLEEDVSGFCKMFDYRNNGGSFGDKRDAPERAAAFLTGHKKI